MGFEGFDEAGLSRSIVAEGLVCALALRAALRFAYSDIDVVDFLPADDGGDCFDDGGVVPGLSRTEPATLPADPVPAFFGLS